MTGACPKPPVIADHATATRKKLLARQRHERHRRLSTLARPPAEQTPGLSTLEGARR
ncbi:hypothetical protein [Parafrankia sp. EAN1pec]|uniref:hypothetical protein n=1 Tax=Parafrankia sp. (strain EAN1pec) TaxID=298653 RepID=UPI00321A36DB